VESNQTLAFEWRAMGTFAAPLATPEGQVSPNGKMIDIRGSDFWRFEDDLIGRYHIYFDQLSSCANSG
jgi:hypothetical protein